MKGNRVSYTIPDNPYEKGRQDERAAVLKYLRDEMLHLKNLNEVDVVAEIISDVEAFFTPSSPTIQESPATQPVQAQGDPLCWLPHWAGELFAKGGETLEVKIWRAPKDKIGLVPLYTHPAPAVDRGLSEAVQQAREKLTMLAKYALAMADESVRPELRDWVKTIGGAIQDPPAGRTLTETAAEYAARNGLAATNEWCAGWDACRSIVAAYSTTAGGG